MRPLISILTLTILVTGALGQESWVGKTVLLKRRDIKIQRTEAGRQVDVGELNWPSYKVTGEKEGWLKVTNEQGASGWFDKEQAVLLEDAPAYFSDLIRKDPEDANAYFMRAVARTNSNELDLAIKDLDEVLRLDPGWAGAYGQRALCWNNKRQYAKAIADYSQSLRLDPTANNYNNRGNTYRRMREYEKARADFQSALRIDPKFIYAYDGLAWLLATCPDARYRDGKEAVTVAKKGLALAPKDATLMEALAAAYAEAGDFAQAVSWQEQVIKDPDFNTSFRRGLVELYRNKEPYRQDP